MPPVQEQIAETQPDPATSPVPDPAASTDAGAAPGGPSRPEGLPDSFWDATVGVRTDALIQSYNELAGEQARLAEAFKDFPEDVAKAGEFYKLPEQMLPEGMKLPEGVTFTPNMELLELALPVLHQHRIDPAAFQDLARAFSGYELQRYQTAVKEFAEDGKKLGGNAAARRKAVADGLAGMVGPELAGFVDTKAITSGAVEFFEAILAKFTNQSTALPGDQRRDTDPPPAPKSIEQRWYGEQRAN